MKLNREKTKQLMNTYSRGNYNQFARDISMDPAHVHRFLTKEVGGGKMMIGAIMKYCKVRGLNFEDYIEL